MDRLCFRSQISILVLAVCMLVSAPGNASMFDLGLNIGYSSGQPQGYLMPTGYPLINQGAFGTGGLFQQGFGGFQQGIGGMQQGFGSIIGAPGGPMTTTYFPWARPTDSYVAGQLGIGAAQWDQLLPPNITIERADGVRITQEIPEDVRFFHELKQAYRSQNVWVADVAPRMPRLTVNNNYSFPSYVSMPQYTNVVNQPWQPNIIPPSPGPGPTPEPGPIPVMVHLPGGNGGVNPTI